MGRSQRWCSKPSRARCIPAMTIYLASNINRATVEKSWRSGLILSFLTQDQSHSNSRTNFVPQVRKCPSEYCTQYSQIIMVFKQGWWETENSCPGVSFRDCSSVLFMWIFPTAFHCFLKPMLWKCLARDSRGLLLLWFPEFSLM